MKNVKFVVVSTIVLISMQQFKTRSRKPRTYCRTSSFPSSPNDPHTSISRFPGHSSPDKTETRFHDSRFSQYNAANPTTGCTILWISFGHNDKNNAVGGDKSANQSVAVKAIAVFPKEGHASAGLVELSKQEAIDLGGRKMYNEDRAACRITYLSTRTAGGWRKRSREREQRERVEAKNEAHPPKGPVPLLTPYVPRRLNVPFTRR